MKFNPKFTAALGLLATFALTSITPAFAGPDNRQNTKNQWRNLAAVGAAIAGYGILKHNQTATILGAAGAAYSANRYEKDRRSQSQNNDNRRYHRSYGWNPNTNYDNNSNYNGGGYNSDNNNNDNNSCDNNNGYNNNGYNNNGNYDSYSQSYTKNKHHGNKHHDDDDRD